MDDIEADRLYKYPDVGIMVNLGFCLVVSVPLFAAFCFLRKRIFRIYDANLANRNRYPPPISPYIQWLFNLFPFLDRTFLDLRTEPFHGSSRHCSCPTSSYSCLSGLTGSCSSRPSNWCWWWWFSVVWLGWLCFGPLTISALLVLQITTWGLV